MRKAIVFAVFWGLLIGSDPAISSPIDTISEALTRTAQDRYGEDSDLYIGVMDFVDAKGTYYLSSMDGPQGYGASIVPTVKHPSFRAVLQPCINSNLAICIDAVAYRIDSSSTWINAALQKDVTLFRSGDTAITFEDGTTQKFGTFPEDLKSNRPAGGDVSIWKMFGAEHKGGSDYLVSAVVSTFPRGYDQNPFDLYLQVTPIRVTSPNDVRQYGYPNNLRLYQFPKSVEFRVILKLGPLLPKLSKWFTARLNSPTISISGELLEVAGKPVSAPLARTLAKPCTQISAEQRMVLEKIGQIRTIQEYCEKSGVLISISNTAYLSDNAGFELFQVYENETLEIGKNSLWSLEANHKLSECNSEDITGFVSSNAMLFTPNPPTFDKGTRTLNYRIASPHLDRNGDVNVGNFDLILRKSVARCLWKIDSFDFVQANISITYPNGKSVVGNSFVSSLGEWIRVNVTNFTFSNPNIAIQLLSPTTVKPSAEPTPASDSSNTTPVVTPTPSPTLNVPQVPVATPSALPSKSTLVAVEKRSTITCIKGKLTKRVSGINPKCPTGFKKK